MAMLVSRATDAVVVLGSRHMIGRSAASDTRLRSPGVSGEHAVVTWADGRWTLRDLGSRNGTFVDGRRLDPGERIDLSLRASLVFGVEAESWTVTSVEEPSVVARAGARVVEGEGTFLALPGLDDPEVVVQVEPGLGWVLVGDEGPQSIGDRARLVVRGTVYEISLPGALASTAAITPVLSGEPTNLRLLGDVTLDLGVSADEEYVEVTARLQSGPTPIPPRAHHYLLLVLARARLQDAADGVTPGERGWLYTSDLRKALGVSANAYYVMAHRCRRDFEELGVVDAGDLFQKRSTSRQIRLGISEVTVRSL
jgi:hypothetical protein